MLKLILRQANWGILGAIFGFAVGFFVKIYLIDIVGLEAWGKYATAQTFSSISETFLSIGIPFVIIKFIPSFVNDNQEKASRIASVFIKYASIVGGLFLTLVYFSSDYINHFVYSDIDDLSWILLVMCIHVPISMLFGVVISLYRSVLKIKEIVLYGTVVAVTVRAILTFIIFQYTADISHFILIEVFTQIVVLSILLYLFNKNEFSLFVKSDAKEVTSDSKMVDYGKKMFYNSVIAFISGQALSFIISIKLPIIDVGAYNILLALTGLTTFLLINLNKVFAPAISKLYHENKISELNELYKKTTFLINLFTIPLAVIIAIFADEILGLYTAEMLNYKKYLFFMLAGGMLSLAAGSSGTFMVMAGLEKQNLHIQIVRAVLLIVLSLILIPILGLFSVVILYVIFMLFVNLSQLIYISKYINISPFSKELILLFFLTILGMYFAISQQFNFEIYHYFIIPIGVYVTYFSIMYYPFKKLIKELL
jgi:O-antigen/teichoic acid export membrane protein